MAIDLYWTPSSPPCWTVQLTAAALGVKLNLKAVKYQNKEHHTPEFLKMNPQHTLPTIVDDGFSLWESRAISRYLVNKYGAGSSLYPEDPKARALVDQRLDFDVGTLYARFTQHFFAIFAGGPADETSLKKLEEALGFLNTFLEGGQFAAGPQLTLADLSLVASVTVIELTGCSLEPYPNIQKWIALVKSTAPGYEDIITVGLARCKVVLKNEYGHGQ